MPSPAGPDRAPLLFAALPGVVSPRSWQDWPGGPGGPGGLSARAGPASPSEKKTMIRVTTTDLRMTLIPLAGHASEHWLALFRSQASLRMQAPAHDRTRVLNERFMAMTSLPGRSIPVDAVIAEPQVLLGWDVTRWRRIGRDVAHLQPPPSRLRG